MKKKTVRESLTSTRPIQFYNFQHSSRTLDYPTDRLSNRQTTLQSPNSRRFKRPSSLHLSLSTSQAPNRYCASLRSAFYPFSWQPLPRAYYQIFGSIHRRCKQLTAPTPFAPGHWTSLPRTPRGTPGLGLAPGGRRRAELGRGRGSAQSDRCPLNHGAALPPLPPLPPH